MPDKDHNEMQRDSILDKALNRAISDPNAPVNLKKQTRFHERAIQLFLLACGLVSILTTIGILVVLLSESLTFFSRDIWENTNRGLSQPIDAETTVFQTLASGADLDEGGIIRISDEVMLLEEYDSNKVDLEITGTGGGFGLFCASDDDLAEGDVRPVITGASRPIKEEELATCRANGIEPLELRIGTDALAVVVNNENDFLSDVTIEDLAMIFGGAQLWSDVQPAWPNRPIGLFIPGTDSGTFDFFVETVYDNDATLLIGENGTRISDDPNLVTSEDDTQLVRNISTNPYAIGFFGYAYYENNQGNLTALSVEGIAPSAETVEDKTYPLGRPLFIYVSQEALANDPHIANFVNFYLQEAPAEVEAVGYFPASVTASNTARTTFLETIGESVAATEEELLTLPAIDFTDLSGDIHIVGSSTVAPLTEVIKRRYQDDYLPIAHVVRGWEDTEAVSHAANDVIEVGQRVSLVEFFTGTEWQPAIRDFGIFPLVYGTLATSLIAMLVALPLGMGAAIYLSEYAPENVRKIVKPILEVLAGIPTVVYGYFALTFMTPLLQTIFGKSVQIYNSASAGIVVGILIIPMVSSMAEDALSAVPRALRNASYGLGATKLETTVKVVLPAALSGIMAAFIIAISRAIGETMIVAIAAGAGPQNNIPHLLATRGPGILFEPAETMTGHIARISGGDLSYGSIDYNSIFAIGLLLFVITLVLNLINNAIIRRFREAY